MLLSNPPASIAKSVKPFISRANELATVKPSISYFCKLYAARIILDAKLHVDNEEVTVYVSKLLDDIEELKDNASEELSQLLNDDALALKYIKDFAFEIFDNLNQKVENKCVTKNTALEFIASVNFLQLTTLWEEELSKEQLNDVKQRIKYAKFQAARILKCIKNGTNPNDYEVEKKETNELIGEKTSKSDEESQSIQDHVRDLTYDSDIEKPSAIGSISGKIDSDKAIPDPLESPIIKLETSDDRSLLDLIHNESSSLSPDFVKLTKSLDELEFSNAKKDSDKNHALESLPTGSGDMPRPFPVRLASSENQKEVSPSSIMINPKASRHSYTKQEIEEIMDNAEIISKAQKHAKFAISALNYEDKDTAIKELMISLSLLKQ